MRLLQEIQLRLDDNCATAARIGTKRDQEQAISDKFVAEMTASESCALCTPGD
jgi:hypothetical protein